MFQPGANPALGPYFLEPVGWSRYVICAEINSKDYGSHKMACWRTSNIVNCVVHSVK